MENSSYVLITPARNERENIERTIRSVAAQSLLPRKWIIVSDGSTDGTDEIVKTYVPRYPFIELVRAGNGDKYNFGSKVHAFNAGYASLGGTEYDYIGNLDADITFQNDYFERLLVKMNGNGKLGLAGGMVSEFLENGLIHADYNINSVAGAVQMFRRRCFDEIGGYLPLRFGGIDAVAEVMARMHGWQVRSFQDLIVHHHGRIGISEKGVLSARWRFGKRDYSMGMHPLFMLLKSISRFREKPYVIGSMFMMGGYMWSLMRNARVSIPRDVLEYTRREQIGRIIFSVKHNTAWKVLFRGNDGGLGCYSEQPAEDYKLPPKKN
ncbi:MAG: glycosyltransferase family A protein [Nitrospiraceae bacterium]|nr:glycosyltransferase family A protein [Nitrospiraceae bacterium]